MSDKQMHLFLGMGYVKEHYAKSGLTDSGFSQKMNEDPKLDGYRYSYAHVRQYRQALKISNNVPRNTDSAKVTEAKKLLEQLLLINGAEIRKDLKAWTEDFLK